MDSIETLASAFEENKDQIIADYFHFLKFKTISSEVGHEDECQACAAWLRDYLLPAGFDVEIIETPGSPLVFVQWLKAGTDKPTLMLYGHYDVQPVDPIELWETPPFEPTQKGDLVFCRGAEDNKGQIFYTISALKTLLERDHELPINVKVCIEGDEEHGSEGLSIIAPQISDRLKADYLVVVDVGMKGENEPSITVGVRGIVTMTVELTGSSRDLHSGTYGGIAYNPNRALVELLSKLHDENGVVTVPGFYDRVVLPSDEELKAFTLDLEVDEIEKTLGVKIAGGEIKYPPSYWKTIRPTLEINGISGGYAGNGFKTVIPQKAIAKISARLVLAQDPEEIGELVARYLKNNVSSTMSIKVTVHEGKGAAVRVSPYSDIAQALKRALEAVNKTPCCCVVEGGTIGFLAQFSKVSGAEAVLYGYGLPSGNIHAPNENFGLSRFKKGFLTTAALLWELG